MSEQFIQQVHDRLKEYRVDQIQAVISMLEAGDTVPFIARYRKEKTGALDEVAVQKIKETHQYVENLEERRQSILKSIDSQGKLTSDLKKNIEASTVLQTLEDLYAPYKKKRRTKATQAKEAGLEPLAEWLYACPTGGNVHQKAETFINEKISSGDEALAGAHEIICEWISENVTFLEHVRTFVFEKGSLVSKKRAKAEDDQETYAVYYDFEEKLKRLKPYQVLAINRAEKEKIVTVSLEIDEFPLAAYLVKEIIKGRPVSTGQLQDAIQDSLERFLLPQAFRYVRSQLNEQAEDSAISTFSTNLEHLLMQQPLKGKVVLGWDPAYRTGCKLAILSPTGQVLDKTVVYPTPPKKDKEGAKKILKDLISKYGIDVIAIGNGTASRESEEFVASFIKEEGLQCTYTIVSESGASVYSASPIAREEFPDYNVEERSAVSIGRRLQDPLAELVKINPQAIGVGQYQHDVSQSKLSDQLDFIVELVVNRVGVDVNTASASLLAHVSGLSKNVAKNLLAYRNEQGKFTNREEFLKVPRLGPKAYEQAAGFLRIREGDNPLDSTGIHPESYPVTLELFEEAGYAIESLHQAEVKQWIKSWNLEALATSHEVGLETLTDIQTALLSPGRDPREEISGPILRQDVMSMEDLKEGMCLQGTVRNVVDFGAFVDIGVKQDGLVHISRLSEKYITDPKDVVSVGDIVEVWVVQIDKNKGRIWLSMIGPKA